MHNHITNSPEFTSPSYICSMPSELLTPSEDAERREQAQDSLERHRKWQQSDPLYKAGLRAGEDQAYRTMVAQFRGVLEVAGESAAIEFIFSLERTYECGLCGYVARADKETLIKNRWTFGNHPPTCERHSEVYRCQFCYKPSDTGTEHLECMRRENAYADWAGEGMAAHAEMR